MPEWGRVLLAGFGCFLLAWLSLWLASPTGGMLLWLPDALLIHLAMDRSGRALGAMLAAGAIGIVFATLPAGGAVNGTAVLLAAASILHVALARFLLLRYAPGAPRLETAGALAHLLLWSALSSPILGAAIMSGAPLTGDGSISSMQAFVAWWIASGIGTAILLPFILSLVHSGHPDPGLLARRWRDGMLVLAFVVVIAAVAREAQQDLPLFLGVPVVLWSALRLDFRITSLLCVVLALAVMASAAPAAPYGQMSDALTAAAGRQAFLLAIVVPALFASLLTQEERAGERTRRTSMHALRALVDSLPLAVVTAARDGNITLWSRGAERIFGWRRREVEGAAAPFATPEDSEKEASLRQRVLAGNEIENQPAQRRDKDGAVRELVVRAGPQRDPDGAITGTITVMEDVTDRRRLEASRNEQQAKLAAILDAIADPIITSDEDGTITGFSRAAEAVFGYSAAEVIGRNLQTLMSEPDDSRREGHPQRDRETGVARTIGTNRQVTARRKDGSTFPAEVTISEAWRNGKRIFAGMVRDLSAQPSVQAAAGPALQSDPGSAGFLSRITHDLRQPLHALSLMTGALERRVTDPESRGLVEDLSSIVRSLQASFENMAEWARLDSGPMDVAIVDVQAGDILTAAAEEFDVEAARHRIALRRVSSSATIACDPALLRRILRQFLDNAMRFAPQGKVLLGARRRGAVLRLVVADTGPGIPADQLDAVFEAYAQLDSGREAGGLGLGLAIARRLAENAGWRIGVRSILGKGSQFWIDVPLSR